MANNKNNWFMNVGKSVQYGAGDVAGRVLPNAGNLVETNASFVTEKLDALRKQGFKKGLGGGIKNNQQLKIGREALANAISDIKSGNIYNKERQKQQLESDDEFGGFGGGDSGFDSFDFDEGQASFAHNNQDDYEESNNDTRVAIKTMSTDVTDNLKSNGRTVKASTDRLVQAGSFNTEAVITSFNRTMSPIAGTLGETKASISNIEDFQLNSVKRSLEETKAYQTQTIELLTSQNDYLKKISESMARPEKKEQERSRTQYDDVFGTGSFSLEGYAKAFKSNSNDALAGLGLSQIKDMWGETSQLKYLAANPLGFVVNKGIEKVIPAVVQQTMKQVDESFANFIPAMFMRLSREGEKNGGFMGILNNFFGIKSSTTGKVNLGRFERGPIPFDGETKKAITEVIPGYLRKMLAVLSKQDEISYDYKDGTWKNTRKLAMQFKEDRENTMMSRSGYRNVYNESIRLAERTAKLDNHQMADLEKGLRSTLMGYLESGSGVNMSSLEDIMDSMKDFQSDTVKKFAAQLLKDGMKDQHMSMMGSGIMKGRSAEQAFINQAELDSLGSYASIAQNGLLEMGKSIQDGNDKVDKAILKLGTDIYGSDRYGLTTQDYVRDIRDILLNGIKVFNSGSAGSDAESNPNAAFITERQRLQNEYDQLLDEARRSEVKKRFTTEQENKIREQGGILLNDLKEGSSMQSLGSVLNQERTKMLQERDGEKEEGLFAELKRRMQSGDSAKRVLKERMDSTLAKPGIWLSEQFKKFDEWMYKAAFPDPDGVKGDRSFIAAIGDKVKDTFTSVKDFAIDNVYKPLKDTLFGEKGIFTKMKGENGIFTKAGNFFLGQQEIHSDGTKGRRMGGAFSSLMDGMYDMTDMLKQQFTGKEYTDSNGVKHAAKEKAFVPSMMKMIESLKGGTKGYLMGDKNGARDVDKKGIVSTIFEGAKTGIGNWNKALFGNMGKDPDSVESKRTAGEAAKSLFNKLPKLALMGGAGALAGAMLASGTGIIGAVLLPGSIATVMGGGLGLASQSERFMTKMFGEKNVTGERIGGIVSRSTQDFFKNNKNVIIGGGALGLLKSIVGVGGLGMLGTAVMGPIGMAGVGIAGAMAYRSNAMQNMLFGKMDADTGKRLGGLLNKTAEKDKKFKDLLPNTAIGAMVGGIGAGVASYGLLGSMFGPFGMIGGALLGTASGIALSSKKFNKFLFGTWDEETGLRDGGVAGRFGNWFEHSIKNPMYVEFQQVKLNVKKWFTNSITNPFKQAIDPLKKAFTNMISKVNESFTNSWEVIRTNVTNIFQDKVGKPFGEFMNKYIMGPVKKIMKTVLYTPFKVAGAVAAAPFQVGAKVGERFEKRHMKQGVNAYRQDVRDTEGIPYFQKLRMMYFDKDAINAAKTSEAGADYADPELRAKRNKELAKQEAEFQKEQDRINAIKDRHNRAGRLAAKYNYETFIDVDDSATGGKRRINLGRLLNVNNDKRGNNFANFMQNGSNADEYKQGISEALGIPLQMLLGTDIADDIDPSKLSANQRKLISRAFKKSKGSIKGNELLRKMGIQGDVRKFDELRKVAVKAKEDAARIAKTKDELAIDGMTRIADVSVDNTNRIVEAIKSNGLGLNTGKAPKKAGTLPDLNNMNQMVKLDNLQFFGAAKEDEPVKITEPSEAGALPQKGKTFKEVIISNIIRIARFTRSISMDTKNQLDGVGSNVYKVRRILQKQYNVTDEDISGSANKDRVGTWGRIRRGMMNPIMKIDDYLRTLGERILGGVKAGISKYVVEPVKSVVSGIKAIGKFAKDVVVGTVKGIGSMAKTLLIDLPKGLINVTTTAVVEVTKGIGKVLSTSVKAIGAVVGAAGTVLKDTLIVYGSVIKGFGKAAGSVIAGFGKGVGNIIAGLGTGVGSVLKTMGNGVSFMLESIAPVGKALIKGLSKAAVMAVELPFKIFEGVGKAVKTTVEVVTNFTVSAIKTVGQLAIDIKNGLMTVLKGVGKAVWGAVKAPFQLVGKGISALMGANKPKEVRVVGGFLDSINGKPAMNTVKSNNPIGNGKFNPIVSLDNLQFFGGEKDDNTNLNTIGQSTNANSAIKGSKLRSLFKVLRLVWTKKNPLPVSIINVGNDSLIEGSSGTGGSGSGSGGSMTSASTPTDAGGSTSVGDVVGIAKGVAKGTRGAAAGAFGLTKGIMSAKGAEKGARATAFKGAFKEGFSKVNGASEQGKPSAVTGVGSGVVATPGKLSKAKLKLSNNYSAGFDINRNSSGGQSNASFVGRKNVGHLQAEAAQAQEMEEQAIFRFTTVDLLSKIEWNTRMTYEALKDLNGMLPKLFKNLANEMLKGMDKLGDKLDEILKALADGNNKLDDANDALEDGAGDGGGTGGDSTRMPIIRSGGAGRGGAYGARRGYGARTGGYGNGRGNVIVNVNCGNCGKNNPPTGGAAGTTTGVSPSVAAAAGMAAVMGRRSRAIGKMNQTPVVTSRTTSGNGSMVLPVASANGKVQNVPQPVLKPGVQAIPGQTPKFTPMPISASNEMNRHLGPVTLLPTQGGKGGNIVQFPGAQGGVASQAGNVVQFPGAQGGRGGNLVSLPMASGGTLPITGGSQGLAGVGANPKLLRSLNIQHFANGAGGGVGAGGSAGGEWASSGLKTKGKGGIFGSIGRGIGGIGRGATGIATDVGLSLGIMSLMTNGVDGTVENVKNLGSQAGSAISDKWGDLSSYFGWDKPKKDKDGNDIYGTGKRANEALKESALAEKFNSVKKDLADKWNGIQNNTTIGKAVNSVKEFGSSAKDHISEQGEVAQDLWADIKNLDGGAFMEDLMGSDLKYVAGGLAGLGAYKAYRGVRNMRKARDLHNRDMVHTDMANNERGLMTRSHIQEKARRRTARETVSDSFRNRFGLTSTGRAKAKEERETRRNNRIIARADLRDYDSRVNVDDPSMRRSTSDIDNRYLDSMKYDRNGREIRDPHLRNIDWKDDQSVASLGARRRGVNYNGDSAILPMNAKYETGGFFERARNRYAPGNYMDYRRYRDAQEDYYVHDARRSGVKLKRRSRVGGAIGTGAIGALTMLDPTGILATSALGVRRNKHNKYDEQRERSRQESVQRALLSNQLGNGRVGRLDPEMRTQRYSEDYQRQFGNDRTSRDLNERSYRRQYMQEELNDGPVRRFFYNPDTNDEDYKKWRRKQELIDRTNASNPNHIPQQRRQGEIIRQQQMSSQRALLVGGDFLQHFGGSQPGATGPGSGRAIINPAYQQQQQRVSSQFDDFNNQYGQTGRQGSANGQTRSGRRGRTGGKLGAISKIGSSVGGFMKGKGGRIAGMLGKNALKIGGAALGGIGLAAGIGLGAKNGVARADEIFNVKEGEKATGDQKKAAGIAGGMIGAIPFADMLDEALGGKMTKWIANVSLDVMNSFDGIKKKMSDGWKSVKDSVSKVMSSIKKATSKVWNGIKNGVSKGWNKVKSGVMKVVDKVKSSTTKVWNSVKNAVTKGWNKVKSGVTKAVNKVKSATSKVWNGVKNAVTKAWNKVKSTVTKGVNKIKSATSKVWNGVKNAVSKGWNKVKSVVTKGVNKIKSSTSKVWEKVKSTVTKVWNNVKDKITSVVKSVYTNTKEKFEAAKQTVVDNFTKVKTTITEKVKAIFDTTKEKFESAKKAVVDKFKSLVTTISGKATDIYNSVVDPVKNVASTIKGKLSGLKDSVSSWLSNLNPFGSGTGPRSAAKKYGAGPNIFKERLYGAGPLDNDGAYYSQNDARWSSTPLASGAGSASFGEAGCGPTAASMLVSSVKSSTGAGIPLPQVGGQFGAGTGRASYGRGDEASAKTNGMSASQMMDTVTGNTPKDALKYAQKGGFVDGQRGTRDDFFASYGSAKNVQIRQKSKPDAEFVKSQLAAGNKMILRGEGGRNFTSAGHYVVATGIDKSGRIKVKDPISSSRSGMFDVNSVVKNATDAYVAGDKAVVSGAGDIRQQMYGYGVDKDITGRMDYAMDSMRNDEIVDQYGQVIDNDIEGDVDNGEMISDSLLKEMMSAQIEYPDEESPIDKIAAGFGRGKKYKYTAEQVVSYINGLPAGTRSPYAQIRCNGGWACSSAFDCSGLVLKSVKHFGGKYPGRTSRTQYTTNQRIKTKDLRVGDLAFFTKNGQSDYIYHVAIVTGVKNGYLVLTHTSNPRVGLRINHVITQGWDFHRDLYGFARLRDMKPGSKLSYKHSRGPLRGDKNAKDDTYKDNGKVTKVSKKTSDKVNSAKSTTKTIIKKTAITTDPFEKLGLVMNSAVASMLSGKAASLSSLKKSLYTTEKITKYIPGKGSSSSKDKSKTSKNTDKKGNNSHAKLTDTVTTVGITPTYKPRGIYKGNGLSIDALRKKDIRVQDNSIRAKDLNTWYTSRKGNSPGKMKDAGQTIIDASAKAGLDPRYVAAHAAIESSWGQSNIVRDKNNFFGIGAFDKSPYASAYSYKTPLDGLTAGASWISSKYPNSAYKQTSLYKMRFNGGKHQYATDPVWDRSIAATMRGIRGTKTGSGFGKFGAGNAKEPKASIKPYTVQYNGSTKVPKGMKQVSYRKGDPNISVRSNVIPTVTYGSGELRRHQQAFAKGDAITNGTTLNTIYSTTNTDSTSSDSVIETLQEIAQNTRDTVTAVQQIRLPDGSGSLVVAPQISGGSGQRDVNPSSAQKNAALIAAGR